ncbi:MAG: hypothetical protein JO280_08660 [Mycobacteriaceae bacterium]|nr:hypothetical protein [Mycobacteriaceae bacterium]
MRRCLYDTDTQQARYCTFTTNPNTLRTALRLHRPALVVFETCIVAGWAADACGELGLPCRVADPNNDAWRWS